MFRSDDIQYIISFILINLPSDASKYGADVKSGQSTTVTLTLLNSSDRPLCNTKKHKILIK